MVKALSLDERMEEAPAGHPMTTLTEAELDDYERQFNSIEAMGGMASCGDGQSVTMTITEARTLIAAARAHLSAGESEQEIDDDAGVASADAAGVDSLRNIRGPRPPKTVRQAATVAPLPGGEGDDFWQEDIHKSYNEGFDAGLRVGRAYPPSPQGDAGEKPTVTAYAGGSMRAEWAKPSPQGNAGEPQTIPEAVRRMGRVAASLTLSHDIAGVKERLRAFNTAMWEGTDLPAPATVLIAEALRVIEGMEKEWAWDVGQMNDNALSVVKLQDALTKAQAEIAIALGNTDAAIADYNDALAEIERLKSRLAESTYQKEQSAMAQVKAYDEIERHRQRGASYLAKLAVLKADIERLRVALEKIATKYYDWSTAKEVARAALGRGE
jgi:hypothetical protein